MATKKAKKEPISETRREYCRALYAVACSLHAKNLADLALASEVLAWLEHLADFPGRDLFERTETMERVNMERAAGKGVSRDDVFSVVSRLSLDVLSPYVPVTSGCRGFLRYLETAQADAGDPEWWTDAALSTIRAAVEGVNARREADAPTFASVVAKDDERVRRLAAARADDEAAHLRADSS